jgi:asparagine synthase (glutamine-hydrolysing)
VDDLLVKVDIATMAYGLEARSPLLDQDLMEFAASLPSDFKLKRGIKKYILRQAVKSRLPAEIIERRKMGFGVPLASWFRDELKDFARDVLFDGRLSARGYFRETVIRRLWEEHVGGGQSWAYQLWNLLVFELWHRTFIDERPVANPGTATASYVIRA